jgi:hypothetical protein
MTNWGELTRTPESWEPSIWDQAPHERKAQGQQGVVGLANQDLVFGVPCVPGIHCGGRPLKGERFIARVDVNGHSGGESW